MNAERIAAIGIGAEAGRYFMTEEDYMRLSPKKKRLEFQDRGPTKHYESRRFFIYMADKSWADLLLMWGLMFLSKLTGKEVVYRKNPHADSKGEEA